MTEETNEVVVELLATPGEPIITPEFAAEYSARQVVEEPKPEVVENLITATPVVEPVKENPKNEKASKKVKSKDAKKVALYSEKNLHMGAASLKIGYNIVSEEAAEKWLKVKSVRKATPEEVKTAYGD